MAEPAEACFDTRSQTKTQGSLFAPPPPPKIVLHFLEPPKVPEKNFDWPKVRRKIGPNILKVGGPGVGRVVRPPPPPPSSGVPLLQGVLTSPRPQSRSWAQPAEA